MSLNSFTRKTLVPLALTAMVSAVHAQAAAPALPDPASTSVQAMGWMQGFPPAADKTIRFTAPDYFAFPKQRWTVCNFRQLMPTVGVAQALRGLCRKR